MATKLIKPISREIEIADEFGKLGLAIITLYSNRLEIRKKGTSRILGVEFSNLNKVFKIPHNAPAKFANNPIGWITND